MSITVRPYRKGGWEVDITVALPSGDKVRERRKAPATSKSAARRWAEARQQHLLLHGRRETRKEVPTLEAFSDRFMEGYACANRHKPSGIETKRSILRHHLVPVLGHKRLDAISNEDVQRLKTRLQNRSPKTVNNVVSVLNTMLKVAVEWGVIDALPCTIRLLKVAPKEVGFYDFDDFERLVEAAERSDRRLLVLVLLGGEAGLRCGEICALQWSDIDFRRGHMTIQRSEWNGQVDVPKGGRLRRVPMTKRLARALLAYRHLRGPRVLYRDDGQTYNKNVARKAMARLQRRAAMAPTGGIHILRHTFCSHLAMRGAPARAIQELAGHRNLRTTERYMHLSPAAVDQAIRLLDRHSEVRGSGPAIGDDAETTAASS